MPGETIWLFGLPCSGKTTLAEGLIGPNTVHLDGDYLRETLNADLGFSKADRTENLRRAAGVAQAMNDQGLDVVASFITPYRSQRKLIEDVYTDHPNVETMIVPDVDTVAIGRDVGYSIVSVPDAVEGISGTEMREQYEKSELLAGEHLNA